MAASKPTQPRLKRKTTLLGVVFVLLVGGYTMLRPVINEATGWNLPAIAQSDRVSSDRSTDGPDSSERRHTDRSDRGSLADRFKKPKPQESLSKTSSATASTEKQPKSAQSQLTAADESLKFGLLREIGRDRYLSPAGLLYTPGSAEGHRLEHHNVEVGVVGDKPHESDQTGDADA